MFISHDTRDADLAKAFGNLLTDASGGVLKSFRASDRKSSTGIEFGASWYSSIMNRLGDATDVVALLTENSLDRPWILYEAGVAKGKLDTVVFGVAIGVPLDRINIGPFAQFQNSADDEDSLTTLVMQLIQRIPDAEPREEAVRRQVGSFREHVERLLRRRTTTEQKQGEASGDGSVAKLFEEVKVMVNDLTKKLESRSRDSSLPRARRAAATELTFLKGLLLDTVDQSGFGLLVAIGMLREELPWLYELGLEAYHALRSGRTGSADSTVEAFGRAVTFTLQKWPTLDAQDRELLSTLEAFVRKLQEGGT